MTFVMLRPLEGRLIKRGRACRGGVFRHKPGINRSALFGNEGHLARPSNPCAMGWPALVTLECEHVRLEPLTSAHHEDLIAATRDGELWNLHYTTVPDPAEMAAEIARRLALRDTGSMLPFAVIERRTNVAVGMTTYMNIDAESRRLEIGSTWYRKTVQRTAVSTEWPGVRAGLAARLAGYAHADDESKALQPGKQ